MNNDIRAGRFTSSEVYRLMSNGKNKGSFGVPALTYIQEKNMERRLGRPLDTQTNSREISWGSLLEGYVFDKLGLEYRLCSKETIVHPKIDFWCGSPDAEKDDTIADVKCPFTLKAFCELVDPMSHREGPLAAVNVIREEHKSGDKYYFQILSNAILKGKTHGELIVFMPFKSELEAIREYARNYNGDDQYRYRWIDTAMDDELPFLPDGCKYNSLNILRWELDNADKKALIIRVVEAGKELIQLEPVTNDSAVA